MTGQEIEAKFFVRSLAVLERRLLQMEARLIQKRGLEVNQRFDLPDGSLRAAGRVLRLRRDSRAVLTYKGSSEAEGGVLSRTELEVEVGDIGTTRSILEALGYVQIAVYEKYRRVYELGACHVMLDELPIGDFAEIEGPDSSTVRNIAQRLGLEIEYAAKGSYLGIFEHYCAGRDLDPALLTFDALKGIDVTAGELEVRPADE